MISVTPPTSNRFVCCRFVSPRRFQQQQEHHMHLKQQQPPQTYLNSILTTTGWGFCQHHFNGNHNQPPPASAVLGAPYSHHTTQVRGGHQWSVWVHRTALQPTDHSDIFKHFWLKYVQNFSNFWFTRSKYPFPVIEIYIYYIQAHTHTYLCESTD